MLRACDFPSRAFASAQLPQHSLRIAFSARLVVRSEAVDSAIASRSAV